jgi:FkbM family methyltransferase
LVRKAAPGPLLYDKGSTRTASRFGINFELELSDYPGWSLYFHSPVDSSRGLLQFVNEGDTILDIGGNIGQTALMCAQKVGPSGSVISFEPFPETIAKFERNLELNPSIQNVKLEKFGLGHEAVKVQMVQDDANNSAGNRVVEPGEKVEFIAVEIPIKVLDDYVREAQLEKIDLIKIDVEGFEMDVLYGAKETLKRYKPRLFVEVSDEKLRMQNSTSEKLVSFVRSYGYSIIDTATDKPISSSNELGPHTDIFCKFVEN